MNSIIFNFLKEPYMKKIQWLMLTLLTSTIGMNAMDKETQVSAPIATPNKGGNTRAFSTSNPSLNTEEAYANSVPVALTTAALLELSISDDEAEKDQSTQSKLSDEYKTKAYSHKGSWEGAYYTTKAYGEDRHNRKNQYKAKDREKNSKNK